MRRAGLKGLPGNRRRRPRPDTPSAGDLVHRVFDRTGATNRLARAPPPTWDVRRVRRSVRGTWCCMTVAPTPDEIYQRGMAEGRRRLSMGFLDQATTA